MDWSPTPISPTWSTASDSVSTCLRWWIVACGDYNPSHAKQVAKREHDRKRQEDWRQKRASQRDNNVVTTLSHHPVPSRPVPTRPEVITTKTLHGIDELVTRVTQTNAMP